MVRNSNLRVIDPLFNIPDEVGDFDYTDDPEDLGVDETSTVTEGEEPEDYLYDEGDENYFDIPDTPDVLTIVSQAIRTLANGTQVIDLIVEVEDIPGVTDYDFRIVKV